MKKKTAYLNGRAAATEFVVTSKTAHSAPIIKEEFMEDDVPMFRLENGNAISQEAYNRNWNVKKTPLLPKNYKGEHISQPQKR